MEESKRDIDLVKTSMTVEDLNNMIVSMRKLMKRARVRVIHHLISQMKKLRNKKGTDKQITTNINKAERLVQQVKKIKELNIDKAVKFALHNQEKLEDVSQSDLAHKCMVRLSCDKVVQDKVKKWRDEHEDWKSLAAFIQQHISRRMKKKKTPSDSYQVKKRQTQESESTDSEETDDQQAKTTIVENSLLKKPNVQLVIDASSHKSAEKTVAKGKSICKSQEISKKEQHLKGPGKIVESQSESSDEGLSTDSSDSNASDEPAVDFKVASDTSLGKTGLGQSSSTKQSKTTARQSDVGNKEVAVKPAEKDEDTLSGEMVVKRLKLDDFNVNDAGEEDISFLFSGKKVSVSEESSTVRPKRHDPFFEGGSSSAGEDDTPSSKNEDIYESSDEETKNVDWKKARRHMTAESTFIDSLSAKRKHTMYRKPDRQRFEPSSENKAKFQRQENFKTSASHRVNKPYNSKGTGFSTGQFKSQQKNFTGGFKPEKKTSVPDKESQASATLHPSWEASRKKKEQLSAIKPFQGKKIVFDD